LINRVAPGPTLLVVSICPGFAGLIEATSKVGGWARTEREVIKQIRSGAAGETGGKAHGGRPSLSCNNTVAVRMRR